MTRYTYKEWCAIIAKLRKQYPNWDKYNDDEKRRLAMLHGYPYYTKENSPTGIFTKQFQGEITSVNRQYTHWQNQMRRQYRTFTVVSTTERPIYTNPFIFECELTVIYRI